MQSANTPPSQYQDLAQRVVAHKALRNLSWQAIAEGTGLSVVFVTAALLGQHALPAHAAQHVGARLGLDDADIEALQRIPLRGSPESAVPLDPTIYRFHEIVLVYGTTLKELVHEMFGDGIVSAVNFRMHLEKVPDPDGGHRARITLDGKFLPYKPF